MARIQQYHSQISTQTGAPSPIANPADFGVGMGDVGKTLEKVGDQATKIFDALEAKKERDADLWRAKTVAEETVNWTKTFTERELTADLGADGHTKRAIDDLEKRKAEVLAMAPTDASRARLEVDLTRLYGSFTAGAMGFEARSSAAKNLADVKETAGLHQNAVYMDPRRYEEAKNYVFELADSLGAGPNRPYGLAPAAVAEQKRVFEADLAAKMFEGRVDRAKTLGEVNSVISELKGEHWQKVITPAQYERLVTNATNSGKQIEARNEQLAMSSFSAAIQVAETGTPTKRPNFEMVSDPVRREQYIKQWNGAVAIGEIARQTKLTSREEDAALLQKARAGTASSDPEAQLQALRQQDAIIKAVTTKRKLLEADPAAYARDNIPSVGAAYKAYAAAPSEKTRQEYVAEVKAAQRNLGVPPDQTRLLTGDQVAQYRAQVDSIPRTPEGAEQAHNILVGLHRDYGATDSQLVYRQLGEEKVLSGVDLVAARMTDPDQKYAAVTLLRANAEGEKELLKLLPKEEKAKQEIEMQVAQAMAPLAATLNNSIGGVTAANDTAAAARVLATKYATQGISITDAAQRAVKEVATGKYNFAGSFRVPVADHNTGKPLNHYDVSAGASQILRDAAKLDFALPRSLAGLTDKNTKEAAAESLRAFGSWTTDEAEGGLMLRWPTGERVMRDPNSWAAQHDAFRSKPWSKTVLNADEERQFKNWLTGTPWFADVSARIAEENNIPPSKVDKSRIVDMVAGERSDYDYRGAWKAKAVATPSESDSGRLHWPSADPSGRMLKSPEHGTAWKEFFMRQYGKDPDEMGLHSKEAAVAWGRKQPPAPIRFSWQELLDASSGRADGLAPDVGGP